MGVNIDNLRSFYTAAKEGSVSKAAQRLMVTPPAIAVRVRHLEETVGIRLVIREGNSIDLTRAGRAVFKKAEKVFQKIRETETLLEHISILRIGCPEIPGIYLMPKLIAEFEKVCPGIRIIVSHGRDAAMVKSIENRRNDLAVIRCGPGASRLKIKVIGREELVLISSHISVHAPGAEISVRELSKVPFVLTREGSAVREVVLEYLRKFKITPRVALESSSSTLLKEFVRHDNGVAFIERGAIKEELSEGSLKAVRLTEQPPTIAVGIGYLNRRDLSPAARTFLRLLDRSENLPLRAL